MTTYVVAPEEEVVSKGEVPEVEVGPELGEVVTNKPQMSQDKTRKPDPPHDQRRVTSRTLNTTLTSIARS